MGPSTYPHMSQFYLGEQQEWFWQAHNDWLQTMAEWGAIGFCLIVAGLLVALSIPAKRGAANPILLSTLFVSLFLPLVHAVFYFPFQIHSILFTYLVLLAAAISLAFAPPPNAQRDRQAKPLGG
jgi:O-antigen ligase